MFHVKLEHIRRVSFATKLYPRINSPLGVAIEKLKTADRLDGDLFCAGRSKNRDLLTYFGFIADAQRGASTFAQLPLFRRSLKKLISLVERELEYVGAHEVLMPTVIPFKLWEKSKRLTRQQNALDNVYRFKDPSNKDLLLGPTFEESMTQLVGDLDAPHEKDLPLLLYQTSTKFRYEPYPKFGLLRSNEFLMNDLYSFDIDIEGAKNTYQLMTAVYEKIFSKLGFQCLRVESGTGSIGGRYSHEYQLAITSGEDYVMHCNSCGYNYNSEMCNERNRDGCIKCDSKDIQRLQSLELGHTFLLSDVYSRSMNTTIKCSDGSRSYYEMGCFGLGLTRMLGAGLDLFSVIPNSDQSTETHYFQMRWPTGVEPFKVAIISPAKRSKQFHGGSSDFINKLVANLLDLTRDVDILVEDRDKDGIAKRIAKVKSLGIPNIIVVGQKFLKDEPEVEMLTLESDKKNYRQDWFTMEQVCDFVKQLENDESVSSNSCYESM